MIPLAVALWIALAAALAFIYYVHYVEPMHIEVSEVEVPLEHLPEALGGLTIAHLSDFHSRPTPSSRRICRAAIDLVNAAAPDLVVITGDVADGYDLLNPCAGQLRGLNAPLGVWAVLGNHDYCCFGCGILRGSPPPTDEQHRASLAKLGMQVLLNEAECLRVGGVVVALVGVGDVSTGRDNLPSALAAAEGADLVIVLSHSPDILDDPVLEAADLVLCGHTHGGQIALPRFGVPWAPVWRDRRRSAGLMRTGRQLCYVTRGVAAATQARFLCPPEVALLVLRRGSCENVRSVRVYREPGHRPAALEEVAS